MPVVEATTNLLAELRAARQDSDRLFDVLKPEALYERPIAERHRVLFYIGHLDGFDSIHVCREALGIKSPDPELDALFQAGIDPDSSHLPVDRPSDWPSLDQVKAYVGRCRQHVDHYLERAPESVAFMALEHRQMHLETLAYMFHNFDHSLKRAPDGCRLQPSSRPSPVNPWVGISAGDVFLGKRHDGSFGWDNEYERTIRQVPAFEVQQNSVSNGEYLRFVEAGGPLPHFWLRNGDSLLYRGMFENIPLPLDWPVYVTQAQARAYAAWAGKSLLTEEQFHRAAYGTRRGGPQQSFPWGEAEPADRHGNFNLKRWDPEPVDAYPAGQSAFGMNQMVGNGWQWTSTVFAPLPGFAASTIYPGYSANFFDGQHFVLKGGSARTAARLLRSSFRNWFRADYPYVYATFRCVEN